MTHCNVQCVIYKSIDWLKLARNKEEENFDNFVGNRCNKCTNTVNNSSTYRSTPVASFYPFLGADNSKGLVLQLNFFK